MPSIASAFVKVSDKYNIVQMSLSCSPEGSTLHYKALVLIVSRHFAPNCNNSRVNEKHGVELSRFSDRKSAVCRKSS